MCNCGRKGSLRTTGGIFAQTQSAQSRVSRFETEDFVVNYFVGNESGDYVGKNTGINYGKREFNSKVLVHKQDIADDSKMFSTVPKEQKKTSTRSKKDEVVVKEEIVIPHEPVIDSQAGLHEVEITEPVEESLLNINGEETANAHPKDEV